MVRHKNRYLVVEVNEQGKPAEDSLRLGRTAIYNSIIQKVEQLHGDFGIAAIRSGFTTKYCNEKTRVAIIRTRHGPHKLVASAVPLVTSIQNKQVVVNCLYTGATIRQCQKFLRQHQQRKFDEFCANARTEEEKSALKEMVMNLDAVLEIS